ncbi:MAG: 4Fe-4S cluster-binding domain-containing protein [bacterium]|nr:4Fe-4S cluster-binding domain-containing protein [bacterium]
MSSIERYIGWAYSELKWLTKKEAIQANKERDKLLSSLSNEVNYSSMKNKIYTGRLSPGCLICGQGRWSCMFINGLCTANCFFCPQDRKIKKERPPKVPEGEGIVFNTLKDYLDYLERFDFKGVGFSGGECMLVFEKLLLYIKKIRERFGKEIYLWIYTNGDLIDRDKSKRLKEAGLDEIRFNISARDYDLHCIELAVNTINTVTVEIPAIPEDYEILKKSLVQMQRIGVNYLNLHQLLTTKYNYKNYIDRNYTFLHYSTVPIFESEMTALKLIRYALDNKIRLPINYCSSAYKAQFHQRGYRKQAASLIRENFEKITSAGYIRSLSIQNSPTNIKRIVKIIEKNKCTNNLWSLNDTKTELFFHPSLLKYINFDKYSLIISYFRPILTENISFTEAGKEVILNPNKKLFIRKELVYRVKGLSSLAIKSLQNLFIKNMNSGNVFKYFLNNINSKTKESINNMVKEIQLLKALKVWEHLEVGFPEIY